MTLVGMLNGYHRIALVCGVGYLSFALTRANSALTAMHLRDALLSFLIVTAGYFAYERCIQTQRHVRRSAYLPGRVHRIGTVLLA